MGDGTTSTIVNVKYAPTVAATVTSSVDTDFDTVDTSSDEPKSSEWNQDQDAGDGMAS